MDGVGVGLPYKRTEPVLQREKNGAGGGHQGNFWGGWHAWPRRLLLEEFGGVPAQPPSSLALVSRRKTLVV